MSISPVRGWPYEWVVSTAEIGVRPTTESNASIVDLGLVRTDSDGLVRFEADVRILRPTGVGNGRVLMVIPNRGMLGGLPFSLDAQMSMSPLEPPDAGDGLLLRDGWTVVWCGWQWDVHREAGWLGVNAPIVQVDPGWLRLEFRPDADEPHHALSDSSAFFRFREYPTSDLSDEHASLTVRTTPMGSKMAVPREAWHFTDDHGVVLDGDFKAFHWYELVYRSTFAPVVGVGLLAVRDVAASLRSSSEWCFAFGVSQSGRFLRQLLHEGMNVDEDGHRVFDGVFTHIAGARRGEFNCRYGQPSLTHPITASYGPPYVAAGLLERQRLLGGVPKLMSTNSSAEYWRGDASLLHQDPETGADLPGDPDAREYLIAGTDHLGELAIKAFMPVANPVHTLDPTPVLRALFRRLEAWVCEGASPPASRVPRRADQSALEREDVLDYFSGVHLPDIKYLPTNPWVDPLSTTVPISLGPPTVSLVSAVDETGNEIAGIRLPAVAVPVEAYTGWNPRVPVAGLPNVLYEFIGSRLPVQSPNARPRRAAYEATARSIAEGLIRDGFLLNEDIERVITEAMQMFDHH